MKRHVMTLAIIFFALMAMSMTVYAAGDKPMAVKGEQVTMSGKLTCTFCSLSHPEKPCAKGCCANCMKAGDPPLLTDAKGNQYILLANEVKGTLMTKANMDLTGGMVTVKGILVKGKGIQAIFVDSMTKAK